LRALEVAGSFGSDHYGLMRHRLVNEMLEKEMHDEFMASKLEEEKVRMMEERPPID